MRECSSGVHKVNTIFIIVLGDLPYCSHSLVNVQWSFLEAKQHIHNYLKRLLQFYSLFPTIYLCGRIFFMCFNQNDIAQQIRCRSRGKNLAIFGFQKFRFSLDKKKLNTSKKFAKCKPVPHFSLYFLFWKNLLVLKNKKSIICVNM